MIARLFAAAALVVPAATAAPSDGLPVKSPSAVGMSAERLAAIDRVVTRGITAGGYPGAVSLELKPWPLGTPDPDVILERMGAALRFAREGLSGTTAEAS